MRIEIKTKNGARFSSSDIFLKHSVRLFTKILLLSPVAAASMKFNFISRFH